MVQSVCDVAAFSNHKIHENAQISTPPSPAAVASEVLETVLKG